MLLRKMIAESPIRVVLVRTVTASLVLAATALQANSGWFHKKKAPLSVQEHPYVGEGTWQWVREPEQEKRVMSGIYNRYCLRCHGVDGRGVYDVPDIPNFVDTVWQDSRNDAYIAQVLDLGRGACMPSFRGTLAQEEYWAMARYLRSFDPRNQMTRVGNGQPELRSGSPVKPVNLPPATVRDVPAVQVQTPPAPLSNSPSPFR